MKKMKGSTRDPGYKSTKEGDGGHVGPQRAARAGGRNETHMGSENELRAPGYVPGHVRHAKKKK